MHTYHSIVQTTHHITHENDETTHTHTHTHTHTRQITAQTTRIWD